MDGHKKKATSSKKPDKQASAKISGNIQNSKDSKKLTVKTTRREDSKDYDNIISDIQQKPKTQLTEPAGTRIKLEDMSKYGKTPLDIEKMFIDPNTYSSRLHAQGFTKYGMIMPCKMYTPGEPALKYYMLFE